MPLGLKRLHLVSIATLTVTVTECLVNFTAKKKEKQKNVKAQINDQVAIAPNRHLVSAMLKLKSLSNNLKSSFLRLSSSSLSPLISNGNVLKKTSLTN